MPISNYQSPSIRRPYLRGIGGVIPLTGGQEGSGSELEQFYNFMDVAKDHSKI